MEGQQGKAGKSLRGLQEAHPVVEPLEGRELLAATLAGGLLSVEGTRRDDEIFFRTDRIGGHRYVVTVNGKERKFLRDAVETVSFHAKKGDDRIIVRDRGDVISARVLASGGPGDDVLRGYGVSPAPSVQLQDGSRPLVYAKDYGARGDGVTDDWGALQLAINSAPPGAVLVLEPRTYLLSTRLIIDKPLNIAGNNALLKAANVMNYHLLLSSRLAEHSLTWSEPVTAGQDTFNVAVPQEQVAAGDMVFLEFGQDPNDPNEQHYTTLARVVENTGTQVKLDTPVPYDIQAGTFPNRITRAERLIEDVVIQNLHFGQVPGAYPWINVGVSHARNVTLENLSGRFTVAALVTDSQDVMVRNVTGELSRPLTFAGRVLSLWQTDRVTLQGARVRTNVDAPPVFLESVSRHTTVRELVVNWNHPDASSSDIFHVAGDSYGTFIDDVLIRNAGAVQLTGGGSQRGEVSFGRVTITGDAIAIPIDLVDDLTYKGRRYRTTSTFNSTVQLSAGWKDHSVPLFSGVIKRVFATLSDPTGVQGAFLLNNNHNGQDLVTVLQPGERTVLGGYQGLGANYPANNPAFPNYMIHLYTAADLPPGVTMKLEVEYYPM